MARIEAGTMLSFSGGEWSDKWTVGPFEVLMDFDQAEVVERYLSSIDGQKDGFGYDEEPTEDGFTAWLTLNGYIVDVKKDFRWYVGNHDFEPYIS
jgi:hypothetical protein